MKRLRLLKEKNENELTSRKENDFERVDAGEIIRVGNRNKARRHRN